MWENMGKIIAFSERNTWISECFFTNFFDSGIKSELYHGDDYKSLKTAGNVLRSILL